MLSTEYRNSIYKAEDDRVSGRLQQALEQVQDALIDPATISDLPNNVLSDRIREWRIFAVTTMSLAQKPWFADHARDVLLQVKPIINTYYYHPDVQRRAKTLLADNEGHRYDHWAEMRRDVGKYWMVGSYISNHRPHLNQAMRLFERAVKDSNLSNSKGIAQIELGQALNIYNGVGVPGTILRAVYRDYIHEGFETAREAVQLSGDVDRLAWLCNAILDETSKSGLAKNDLAVADRNRAQALLNGVFEPKRAKELRHQHQIRKLSLGAHRFGWRVTGAGIDFSQIDLTANS